MLVKKLVIIKSTLLRNFESVKVPRFILEWLRSFETRDTLYLSRHPDCGSAGLKWGW